MILRVLPIAVTAVVVAAAAAELQTAEQIEACHHDSFPDDSSVQTISMNAKDRIGAVTTSKATIHWKRFDDGFSRVMMRFFKPPDLRGAGLLMIEKKARNDMFIYLPELGRVKRITSRMTSSSMFGTDFSYEEFERMQGIAESAPVTRGEDGAVDGRPAYVLDARPTSESDSAYERIVSFIDKETCVLLRSEFYERGDRARKVLTANTSTLSRAGDVWLAREYLMRDLRDETETTMIVEEVEVGKPVPRKLFSQRELVSGGN
ncbi:MAG: outer membrane lipoprotein-sorting protein [Deltaproteobacteria bacterium]|nr:outer membrane lipoprotein-sorting protein [Deltaproteobacteria bacterium]